MITKANKVFLRTPCQSKMAYVTNRLQKDERWQRLMLGDGLSYSTMQQLLYTENGCPLGI